MSDLVGNPEDRFCRDAAHIIMLWILNIRNSSEDLFYGHYNMSRVVKKTAFCICENKDADQLRGYREADQRLCFRYIWLIWGEHGHSYKQMIANQCQKIAPHIKLRSCTYYITGVFMLTQVHQRNRNFFHTTSKDLSSFNLLL